MKKLSLIFLLLISSCVETKRDILSSPNVQSSISTSKPDNLLVSSVVPSIIPSPTPRPRLDDKSVLILIDTHLLINKLKKYMKEEDVNRYPRKVYILKDSYDSLDQDTFEKLNAEYQEYKVYDPNKDFLDLKESEGDIGWKIEGRKEGSYTCEKDLYYLYLGISNISPNQEKYVKKDFNIFLDENKNIQSLVDIDNFGYALIGNNPHTIYSDIKYAKLSDLYKNIISINTEDSKTRIIKVSSLRGLKYQSMKYNLLSKNKNIISLINEVDPNIDYYGDLYPANIILKEDCDLLLSEYKKSTN